MLQHLKKVKDLVDIVKLVSFKKKQKNFSCHNYFFFFVSSFSLQTNNVKFKFSFLKNIKFFFLIIKGKKPKPERSHHCHICNQ